MISSGDRNQSVARALAQRAMVVVVGLVPILCGARAAEGPGSDEESAQIVATLLQAHNRERADAGLPPLSANPKLDAAAREHARDMARHEKLSHEGSDESTPPQRIERAGYQGRASGENVAAGQENVAEVMRSWMNSPEHKKNILGNFTEMGAAVVPAEDGRRYWCVDFGRPWPVVDPTKAAAELAERINQARARADKSPLKINAKLAQAASEHARALATRDSLEPKEGEGKNPIDRVKELGYRFREIAEEASSGDSDPQAIVASWLKDEQYRKYVLGDFADIGVGYAATPKGKPYWTVLLAKPLR